MESSQDVCLDRARCSQKYPRMLSMLAHALPVEHLKPTIGNMTHMIGRIKILSIPAGRKLLATVSHDSSQTKTRFWGYSLLTRTLIINPAGQAFFGKSSVSPVLVFMFCRHVYVNCRNLFASASLLYVGLPTSIRNPFLKAVTAPGVAPLTFLGM